MLQWNCSPSTPEGFSSGPLSISPVSPSPQPPSHLSASRPHPLFLTPTLTSELSLREGTLIDMKFEERERESENRIGPGVKVVFGDLQQDGCETRGCEKGKW